MNESQGFWTEADEEEYRFALERLGRGSAVSIRWLLDFYQTDLSILGAGNLASLYFEIYAFLIADDDLRAGALLDHAKGGAIF